MPRTWTLAAGRRLARTGCAIALISTTCGAFAADVPSTPSTPPALPPASAPAKAEPVSPAKKELVRRVLALQQPGIDALARTVAENSVRPMMQAAGQALQTQVAMDKREAVIKKLDADVRQYLDETTKLLREKATALAPMVIGPALEQRFTEDELRQTVAWLESSANQKYQALGPDMQNQMAQRLVDDNRASVEPKLRALENRLADTLGLPPAGGASAASGAPAPGTAVKPGPRPGAAPAGAAAPAPKPAPSAAPAASASSASNAASSASSR